MTTVAPAGPYQLGPFYLISDLSLPALEGTALADGASLVRVRLGEVTEAPTGAVRATPFVQAWPQGCQLEIPGAGRFLVRDGLEIVVQLEPGAPPADVQSYILGWCFGALCLQRGMLPLHACAVDFGEGVAAFLGDSGAGKSTLAASLNRAGYPLVADDTCLLAPAATGLEVLPCGQWVKLWQTSLDFLDQRADPAQRTFAGDEKFRVALPAQLGQLPPLTRVVLLARGADSLHEPQITPLPVAAALAAMMDHLYLGYCTEAMGIRPRLFAQCAQVLGTAKAWRLTVPWGFEHLAATVAFLERQVLR